MARFLSRANSALLVLALGCTLGACSFSSTRLTDEIRATVRETEVWNDFMPGSQPSFHATMRVALRNTTEREIILLGAEGLVTSDSGPPVLRDGRHRQLRTGVPPGTPLRRFPAAMLFQDLDTREIRLAPGMEIELTLRSPMGVPPLDQKAHPYVRMTVEFRTSLDRSLAVQSGPVTPFVTQ